MFAESFRKGVILFLDWLEFGAARRQVFES